MVKRSIISEKTLIPISLLLVIIGGVNRFSAVSFATDENKKDIDAITASVKEMQTSVMVDLKDQSANINELRLQNIMLDSKLNAITESLHSMRLENRRLRKPAD